MSKKKTKAYSVAIMGLLMALQIVLTRFLSIPTPFVRIGFSFVAVVLMSVMFTPLIAGVGNAVADFIGIQLFPTGGAFFPGFTLSAFLTAFLYGVFFYKKNVTLKRIILVNVIQTVVISLGLNTYWLYLMYGPGVVAYIPSRIVSSMILCAVHVVGTYWMLNNKTIRKQIIKATSEN